MLSEGVSVPEQASFMPDEFYDWLVKTAAELRKEFLKVQTKALADFAVILFDLPPNATRRDFAMVANAYSNASALFRLYDSRRIDDWCWQQVRPAIVQRPFKGNM